jgi:hypothetical protein
MSDVNPGIHARIPRPDASPSSGGESPLDRGAISRGHSANHDSFVHRLTTMRSRIQLDAIAG